VSFGSPFLLLALLIVPLVLGLALWFDRRRARYAVAFTNLDLLASVATELRRPWRRWIPLALFLLALAAASAALARPRATRSVTSSQATVVLLVDVSGSMRASDVKPTRIGAAQHAMDVFAGKVPKSVKIGLVSFSTGPDVLVPPTTDRDVLLEGIDLLSPNGGTALGDGLGVAVTVVKSAVDCDNLTRSEKPLRDRGRSDHSGRMRGRRSSHGCTCRGGPDRGRHFLGAHESRQERRQGEGR
jgi:Ca-activated chloride channel family protein